MKKEGKGHPLTLEYFRCHRIVLETFIDANVGKTAMRVYLYLSHNCLLAQAVSHKLSLSAIAGYFKRSERTIYRALQELEDAGLGKIRHHGDIVFEMPAVQLAKGAARTTAIDSKQKAREQAVESELESMMRDVESTLGRQLTESERRSLTRRVMMRHK